MTVTGVADELADGDQVFHVITAWALSLDERYHGMNPADIELTNVETPPAVQTTAYLAGTNWSPQLFDQLQRAGLGERQHGYRLQSGANLVSSIAWPMVDVLSVSLSGEYPVTSDWLMLFPVDQGVEVAEMSHFEFSPHDRMATWFFDRPITAGEYEIRVGPPAELDVAGSPNVATIRVQFSPGDLDHDRDVDADDIGLLQRAVRKGDVDAMYDVSADGQLSKADLDLLVHEILGTRYGDANLDGRVDTLDYSAWAHNRFQNDTTWAMADWNHDGMTDLRDLNVWNQNRFTSGSIAKPASEATFGSRTPRATLRSRTDRRSRMSMTSSTCYRHQEASSDTALLGSRWTRGPWIQNLATWPSWRNSAPLVKFRLASMAGVKLFSSSGYRHNRI